MLEASSGVNQTYLTGEINLNFNKSKIDMKGKLSEEGADYHAKKRADAIYIGVILAGIASLIGSVGFVLSVLL
ncbi:MAG: hypothetical protein ACJAYF_003556 [Arenicella sp.]|jgi:hypothetical protein